jgi:hypothetical protein
MKAAFRPIDGRTGRCQVQASNRWFTYINDSQAHKPHNTWFSLSQIPAPVVLVVGGICPPDIDPDIHLLVHTKCAAIIDLSPPNRPPPLAIMHGSIVHSLPACTIPHPATHIHRLLCWIKAIEARHITVLFSPMGKPGLCDWERRRHRFFTNLIQCI